MPDMSNPCGLVAKTRVLVLSGPLWWESRRPGAKSGTGRAGGVARHRHGEPVNDRIQILVGEG